jgi:histidyl-tRNA synthetase
MQISPRILKGFRDSLPDQELIRREAFFKLEKTFRSHGLVPVDTPALEYTEVLLGKGGGETDKQVYSFKDNGNRDVALRFDLTVPFARFMAMHVNKVGLPFKRYHMAKVWRGENTQKGRFREFYQCDFDIVGLDNASADFEILMIIFDALQQLGIDRFTIRISHRGLFNEFLEKLGIVSLSVEILRTVDKLSKIGRDNTFGQLCKITSRDKAEKILSFISCGDAAADGTIPDTEEILYRLISLIGFKSDHLARIEDIFGYMRDSGVSGKLILDPSITRGLDYYTGIVYETFLDQLPGIGSICSGGRYNNLASLYSKEQLPGVGASIGLDRLLAAMEDPQLIKNLLETVPGSWADVIILCMSESYTGFYAKTAAEFRAAGFKAEIYHTQKKLAQQFKYAEKRSIPFAVIAGANEIEKGHINIKNLTNFEEIQDITIFEAIRFMRDGVI